MSESVHQLHGHEEPEPVELTRLERVATWLSLACAVHCLALPLVALAMPVLGAWSTVLHDPTLDRVLFVFVLAAAVPSAAWGYRRHRDLRVLGAVLAGALVYVLGHTLESH